MGFRAIMVSSHIGMEIKMTNPTYVGIDVAQDWLDVWLHPLRKHRRFDNTAAGITKLLEYLEEFNVAKVVLEATGGLEYLAARMLQKAGFAATVVNPYFTSAFRVMRGKFTKTDSTDAEMIAIFSEKMDPEIRPVPTQQEKELKELTARRVQLIEMIVAEKNRLRRLDSEAIKLSIQMIIKILTDEKDHIETRLEKLVWQHQEYAKKYELLTSIPSIGQAVALTLITELPELGKLNKKQIASLTGLAPHNRDSGKTIGKATTKGGGRRCAKAALYMAAITAIRHNPAIKTFYKRLVENGKPKKLAIIACMRKLLIIANQILKEQRPWMADFYLSV